MVRFKLSYTRDRPLITQEAWAHANSVGISDLLGTNLQYPDPILFYVNDGPVEVWEDEEALGFIYSSVAKVNKEDKFFLPKVIEELDEETDSYFAVKWDKKAADSVEELSVFAEKFVKYTTHFLYIWASMLNKTTPKELKPIINKWRKKDLYYENGGVFIKKSLEKIYPQLKGLANYITLSEIEKLPDLDELKNRRKNFIFLPGRYKECITLEEFAKQHPEHTFIHEKVKETDVLKGQVAFKGKASGKVSIVRSQRDLQKVEEGDILVSPMTVPEFLTAMKKAAAFVTDEGGIMSHAAIVARELEKPCVVGTKIATKLLKDGDKVGVDADNGTVRILNKT